MRAKQASLDSFLHRSSSTPIHANSHALATRGNMSGYHLQVGAKVCAIQTLSE